LNFEIFCRRFAPIDLSTKLFNGVSADQPSTAKTPGDDIGGLTPVATSFAVPITEVCRKTRR